MSEYPSDWKLIPIREIITESRINPELDDPSKRISVRLHCEGVEKRSERATDQAGATRYYKRLAGQFIYGKQNLHKGAVGIVPEELDGFCSSQDIPAFDITPSVDPNWFLHLFRQRNFYESLENIATGTGSKRIQPSELGEKEIAVPPLPEQKKIAEILSGIDFAVSSIQKKIDKLRSAKVALAESELIGEHHSNQANSEIGFIPSHWQVKGILEVSSVASGQVDPTSKEYRDMILIAPNHIESGTGKIIGKETAIQQAAISGKYFAKLGAVILSKIRPNLAKVCMADQDCLTSADMYPLTAMSRITPAYLKQVLLSKRFTHYATESSVRGNIPKINREELGGYKFALPPLDEQMTITAGIESIETIIFKEEERVGLLLGLKNSLSSDLLSGRKRVSV